MSAASESKKFTYEEYEAAYPSPKDEPPLSAEEFANKLADETLEILRKALASRSNDTPTQDSG